MKLLHVQRCSQCLLLTGVSSLAASTWKMAEALWEQGKQTAIDSHILFNVFTDVNSSFKTSVQNNDGNTRWQHSTATFDGKARVPSETADKCAVDFRTKTQASSLPPQSVWHILKQASQTGLPILCKHQHGGWKGALNKYPSADCIIIATAALGPSRKQYLPSKMNPVPFHVYSPFYAYRMQM